VVARYFLCGAIQFVRANRRAIDRKLAMSSRQLHQNVNLLHSGVYASAWRLPESDPRARFDVGHYVRVAALPGAASWTQSFSPIRQRSPIASIMPVSLDGTDDRAGNGRGLHELYRADRQRLNDL
jgi:hypothetical protein